MRYVVTTATRKVAAMKKRIRAVPGGTSASKSVSILIWLVNLAQSDRSPTVTSVVSESVPHLKRGCLRDFRNVMEGHGYWRDENWNATDSIYTMETGSIVEFFSTDNGDKLRGARRDRLFINEANNVSYEAFTQLEVRTREFVYMDWNPSVEFWYYTEVKGKFDNVEEVTLTYRDNEALDPNIVASIEARRGNKSWYRVYGEGQLGEVEGRVYSDWRIVDEVPHEARLARRGLDFGYTNDPSALVQIYEHDGGIVVDEAFYQRGMSNRQIGDAVNALGDGGVLTVADSAEPKSIDELRGMGVNVIGSQKGPGSVMHGIQKVRDLRVSVTKRSVNVIREYRNYLFLTDKDGKITNEPDHAFSHAMDALRYGIERMTTGPQEAVRVMPSNPNAYRYGAMRPRV
jgi:phage terminase large subunit